MLDLMRVCQTPGGGAIWEQLEELGLTFPQVKMMVILDGAEGDLSVKDVSELVGISLANASRTVDALVKLGFLDRREDPSDRRMKRVAMTKTGRDAVQHFQDARFQGMRAWADTLSGEQRDALLAVLQTLPITKERAS